MLYQAQNQLAQDFSGPIDPEEHLQAIRAACRKFVTEMGGTIAYPANARRNGTVVSFWRLAECERRLDLKLLRSRRSPEWRYQRSSNRSSRPRLRTQRTPSSLGSSANNRSTRASNCWRVGSSRHSALAAELRPRDPGAFARSFSIALYSSHQLPAPPPHRCDSWELSYCQRVRIPLPNNPDESLPSIRMSADPQDKSRTRRAHSPAIIGCVLMEPGAGAARLRFLVPIMPRSRK